MKPVNKSNDFFSMGETSSTEISFASLKDTLFKHYDAAYYSRKKDEPYPVWFNDNQIRMILDVFNELTHK